MSEGALLTAVQHELKNSPYVATCAIKAAVQGSLIQIEGTVRTYYEKQMAGEAVLGLIRRTNQKLSLTNKIRVNRED